MAHLNSTQSLYNMRLKISSVMSQADAENWLEENLTDEELIRLASYLKQLEGVEE